MIQLCEIENLWTSRTPLPTDWDLKNIIGVDCDNYLLLTEITTQKIGRINSTY